MKSRQAKTLSAQKGKRARPRAEIQILLPIEARSLPLANDGGLAAIPSQARGARPMSRKTLFAALWPAAPITDPAG
jgi:hypothetical protein